MLILEIAAGIILAVVALCFLEYILAAAAVCVALFLLMLVVGVISTANLSGIVSVADLSNFAQGLSLITLVGLALWAIIRPDRMFAKMTPEELEQWIKDRRGGFFP